jgi:hypothetical protein
MRLAGEGELVINGTVLDPPLENFDFQWLSARVEIGPDRNGRRGRWFLGVEPTAAQDAEDHQRSVPDSHSVFPLENRNVGELARVPIVTSPVPVVKPAGILPIMSVGTLRTSASRFFDAHQTVARPHNLENSPCTLAELVPGGRKS